VSLAVRSFLPQTVSLAQQVRRTSWEIIDWLASALLIVSTGYNRHIRVRAGPVSIWFVYLEIGVNVRSLRNFILITMLGGFAVILPAVLLWLIFQWLAGVIIGVIAPATALITEVAAVNQIIAMSLALGTVLASCFIIGLALKTRVGRWLHERLDGSLEKLVPGYRTIRDITRELLGGTGNKSLLNGEVALAKIYGPNSPVTVTAIITSRHGDGGYTVYVPTAPIPTSGITYHLPADCVELLVGISVEEAMRTIVACGAGSATMLERARKRVT
tara:strand:- start:74 stop:892 length:819 start_codon:yes stop_codon:yes gene_type:complete